MLGSFRFETVSLILPFVSQLQEVENALLTAPYSTDAMIRCPDPLKYCGDLVAHVHDYGDKLTVRSVKLFLDGAVGSWGAAMIEPYSGVYWDVL